MDQRWSLPEENNTSVEPLPWSWLAKLCVRVDLNVLGQELLVVRAEVKADPHHRLVGPAFELAFQLAHIREELKVSRVKKDDTVETSESPEKRIDRKIVSQGVVENLWYSGDM